MSTPAPGEPEGRVDECQLAAPHVTVAAPKTLLTLQPRRRHWRSGALPGQARRQVRHSAYGRGICVGTRETRLLTDIRLIPDTLCICEGETSFSTPC